MKQLLIVELYKLIRYKTFWTFFGGYALLYILVASVFYSIATHFQISPMQIKSIDMLTFPMAWHTFSWLGSWFYFLLGLLIILLLTNDFECNTLRQQIIDGFSRERYLAGRYLIICLFAFYACLIVFITGISLGSVAEGGQLFSKYTIAFLFALFLQGVGLLSFALFLSFLIRRAMLATFVFMSFPVIIEPVFGWFLDARIMDGISHKLPLHVFFSYIPPPSFLISKPIMLPSFEMMSIGLFYNGLMIFITWMTFKFSDL